MTTTLTATERGDLAESLLPVAAQLACIVHGDGGTHDVHYVLSQLDPAERDALIVVLAGLINPDTTVTDALGYITWDEDGRPATQPELAGTIRGLARQQWTPTAIPEEQLQQTLDLHGRGLDSTQIGRALGVEPRTVLRWIRKHTQTTGAAA